MPKYPHLFEKNADVATAYANANTQKHLFGVPYDTEGMPKLGTWKESKAQALEDAKKIAGRYEESGLLKGLAVGKRVKFPRKLSWPLICFI